MPSDPPSSALAASQNVDKAHHHGAGERSSPMDSFKSRPAFSNPLGIREDRRNFSNMSSASTIDAPNDATTGPHNERHRQNPYAGLVHASGEPSNSHQPFVTSNLHTQHGNPRTDGPSSTKVSISGRLVRTPRHSSQTGLQFGRRSKERHRPSWPIIYTLNDAALSNRIHVRASTLGCADLPWYAWAFG